MTTATKIKTVAFIALMTGPLLAFMGVLSNRSQAALEKDGITVNGKIVEGESLKGRKQASSHPLDVAFTPQNGAPVTQRFHVTPAFFAAHVRDHEIIDPAVEVRYLAQDPGNASIVGGSSLGTGLLPLGLTIFALGMAGLLGVRMQSA